MTNHEKKRVTFEQEFSDTLLSYDKMYTVLNEAYAGIVKSRNKILSDLFDKDKKDLYKMEDLMFRAAELKNQTIDLLKSVNDLSVNTKIDESYFISKIRLGDADELLKNLGFSKITETIRSSAVESIDSVRKFRKMTGLVKSLSINATQTLDALTKGDEINFRTVARAVYEGRA